MTKETDGSRTDFRLEARGSGQFEAHGALGFATANQALAAGRELFDPSQDAEIDLGGVERLDSAGLAVILEWLSWYQGRAELKLTRVPEQLQSLARISELGGILGVAGVRNT